MAGVYKVKGFTRNASDGNQTNISNFVLFLKDNRLSGTGYYDSGTNYNSACATEWNGTYEGDSIEFSEKYGGGEYPFLYHGFVHDNKLWGTYRWTKNAAVGTFEFELTPIPSSSADK